ncbi:MAG: phosphatidate cytidylyltransferase [Spirochaetia bacterium]|jgi:phosphatidate cytidylyltransferase|nr:phosphatidate cytidylyltransferase [Spirochaetia bacterium]
MNNILTRLILVGLAVPLLFFLALFLPYMNHAVLSLVVLVFVIGSSIELKTMLEPESGKIRTINAVIMGTLAPASVYACRLFLKDSNLAVSWLAPLSIVMLSAFLLSAIPIALSARPDSIARSAQRSTANSLYLIYPGALSSAIIVILSARYDSGMLLIWFAMIVFGNDSLAWLTGITLGRNRGIFAVSPKKSLEGLIAGLFGSVLMAFSGPFFLPNLVPRSWALLGVLGISCGAAVVMGDLFESGIKRAAGLKDSGSIVPGRGGMLDSFDSLMFAAPVFTGILALAGILS